MNIDIRSKLKFIRILYVVEEGVEHDYHVMPFELICDRVHISTFQDSWKDYLEIRPHILMVHMFSDHHLCKELMLKIKKINKECPFLILTPKSLRKSIDNSICKQSDKILFQPIGFTEMSIALEEIINTMNISYFMDQKILFEPHNSVLIYDDKRIELTTKENKLLGYLLQNQHRIVSYDEIEAHVWENTYMNRNTLTSIISNVRRKLGDLHVIKNYSNQGYKIITKNITIK